MPLPSGVSSSNRRGNWSSWRAGSGTGATSCCRSSSRCHRRHHDVTRNPGKPTTDLPESQGVNSEALIKEARQRQRRRWLVLGIVLLIVVAASGIWAASGGRSATKPPASKTATVKSSGVTGLPGSPPCQSPEPGGHLASNRCRRTPQRPWRRLAALDLSSGHLVGGCLATGTRTDRAYSSES